MSVILVLPEVVILYRMTLIWARNNPEAVLSAISPSAQPNWRLYVVKELIPELAAKWVAQQNDPEVRQTTLNMIYSETTAEDREYLASIGIDIRENSPDLIGGLNNFFNLVINQSKMFDLPEFRRWSVSQAVLEALPYANTEQKKNLLEITGGTEVGNTAIYKDVTGDEENDKVKIQQGGSDEGGSTESKVKETTLDNGGRVTDSSETYTHKTTGVEETCASIADKYGVRAEDIAKNNGIEDVNAVIPADKDLVITKTNEEIAKPEVDTAAGGSGPTTDSLGAAEKAYIDLLKAAAADDGENSDLFDEIDELGDDDWVDELISSFEESAYDVSSVSSYIDPDTGEFVDLYGNEEIDPEDIIVVGGSFYGPDDPEMPGGGYDDDDDYEPDDDSDWGFCFFDPLILDLNGDGVKLTDSYGSPVLFDVDNNGGTLKRVGWVSTSDGMLVVDHNNNGKIDNMSEVISEYYGGQVGTGGEAGSKPYSTSIEALKSLDSNQDGVFDNNDAEWSGMRVWVDANHDGKSWEDVDGDNIKDANENSELMKLFDLGITKINLDFEASTSEENGNPVRGHLSFTQWLDENGNPTTLQGAEASSVERDAIEVGLRISGEEILDVDITGELSVVGRIGTNDVLKGNSANNYLVGETGSDIFYAGSGDDVLMIDAEDKQENIHAGAGMDILQVVGDTGVTLNLAQAEAEIAIGGGGDDVIRVGGNTAAIINGGNGDDIVIGGTGSDVLSGDAGDDLVTGDAGSDILVGGAGSDVLFGGSGDDKILGGEGDDYLDGNTGSDILIGGGGDDVYIIESSGKTVIEYADEGTDIVKSSITYTLDTNFENLMLTGSGTINGTGNTLNNIIMGNSGNNTLSGGIGADTMAGGAGNDTYIADCIGDVVNEFAANGIDTVQSSATHILTDNVENLILTGTADIIGIGNTLDNVITGNGGSNVLSGGLGNDSLYGNSGNDAMIGGDGNDVYSVGSTGDMVTESVGQGMDTVRTSIDYILGANVENLTAIGTSWVDGTGNAQDNIMNGSANAGATLMGLAGNDTLSGAGLLYGGDGDDSLIGSIVAVYDGEGYVYISNTIYGENGNDIVIWDAMCTADGGSGIDTLDASGSDIGVTMSLGSCTNFEILQGSTHDDQIILSGTSNATVYGNAGNDTLTGGAGSDTLAGGIGNDFYVVGAGDAVLENDGEGTDAVQTGIAYTLGAAVENLIFTGSTGLVGAGNELNNILTGNSGVNELYGGAGDDTLNGAAGADKLFGGAGNDTYVVDNAGDVVTETANEGIDTIKSGISHTLGANLENLTLTGAVISGAGNTLDNVITGNSANNTLTGNAGNDMLNGGTGADNMIGGDGNDTYVVDNAGDGVTETANGGIDTVQASITYALGTTLENLTLAGTVAINGTGNTLANYMAGNSGNNRLDGGLGADTMEGGAGDDTYVVDGAGDAVKECAGEGVDTVQASASYTLGEYLENLTLLGTVAINGGGNSLDNVFTGNSCQNTLEGGAGNDTYVVGAGDTVIENVGEGADTIQTGISYTLGENVENLTLTGTAVINGTGNSLNNTIAGNSLNNTLTGGGGDDIYVVNNTGDIVVETAGQEKDTIQSSVTYTLGAYVENLILTGAAAINGTGNSLDNTLTGNSGNNTLTGKEGNDIYIVNNAGDSVVEALNQGDDTIKSSVSYTMGANVENMVLTGAAAITGTGNALNNAITGNDGADTLDGGAGADTLIGGMGADTYVVDDTGDVVDESESGDIDTVISSITYTIGATLENLTLSGSGVIDGTGNLLANIISGNSANNRLDGGEGHDTLKGGAGNDTYIVDSDGDIITEILSQGIDTVYSSVNYTIGANVENLTLTGATALNGTGNALVNIISGNSCDNVLNGGLYADTLQGGDGNDTYFVDNSGDFVSENANQGTDTVQSSVDSYIIGANVENLILAGTVATGIGNSMDNTITGNDGANTLDGGAGGDTLTGGEGNDTYVVDSDGDVVTELFGQGADTVQSRISYTLGAFVENLTLTGDGNVDGLGNDLDNILTGNSCANVLAGGLGNDLYVVGAGDTVNEDSLEGIDTVKTSIAYTLGDNVENLTLTGTAAINGTGNSLDNTITGNSCVNILTGGEGNDIYVVNIAGDVVVEADNQGNDTIQSSVAYTLGANVERLVLTGTAVTGTGNSLDNWMVGNSVKNTLIGGDGNDTLNGGAGGDSMIGGLGDDTYVVDDKYDTVSETIGSGVDVVRSVKTYTLTANVENLTLIGTQAINGGGNALDNLLVGNDSDNVLDGGAGTDTLEGGNGSDTYLMDCFDIVKENVDSGTDTIKTSLANYTLGSEIENLTLTGSVGIAGIGNSLDNVLTGNGANNTLTGLAGNDTLNGGIGADTMYGGDGNDTYLVNDYGDAVSEDAGADSGIDTVKARASYTLGANVENLTLETLAAQYNLCGTGNSLNNIITGNLDHNLLTGGAGDDTYVIDGNRKLSPNPVGVDTIREDAGEGIDTVLSSISYTLADNVENLIIINRYGDRVSVAGNALNNVITGDTGYDTIDGMAGADTMAGGVGNDAYVVDNSLDVVTEDAGEGIDTVTSSVSWTLGAHVENLILTGSASHSGTGNELNNTITGSSGNDTLDGGLGSDVLNGGLGNDVYLVDSASDMVSETTLGGGIDCVYSTASYALGDYIENLTLIEGTIGVGSAANNILIGNSLNNILDGGVGNETLDGRDGEDMMIGRIGNDLYIVDNVNDIIVEFGASGTDTVQSSVSYTLADNVENLTLDGNASNGTGNTLTNTIIGNVGNNTLDGGVGNDNLYGGFGDDRYIVDIGDNVVEGINAGIDTVESCVNYTLGINVENLTLTGINNTNGIGNDTDNIIAGNLGANRLEGRAGNDTLIGGLGNDTLLGGLGNDTYIIDSAATITEVANEGIDTVRSLISLTLANNVENLTLSGGAASNGTGNTLNNVITGNSSNNALYGGLGNDTLSGGGGNDILDGSAGEDTATFSGSLANYAVVQVDSTTSWVGAFSGSDGIDTLHDIESLAFWDQTVNSSYQNFNPLQYIASFGDLIQAFVLDQSTGFSHYVNTGHGEGRTATFDALRYIASYGDLIQAFGTDQTAATTQYINYGYNEGRTTTFDALRYIASYGDLIQAFGTNQTAATTHYINGGYNEGRTATFDVEQYLENYADLRGLFGTDEIAATIHYIQHGYNEGRTDALIINGSLNADLLLGTGGRDALFGAEGNDTLQGLGGNDTLAGGNGADTYVFRQGYGHDQIAASATNDLDRMDFSSFSYNDAAVSIGGSGGDDLIITFSATETVTIADWNHGEPGYILNSFNFNDGIKITNGSGWL